MIEQIILIIIFILFIKGISKLFDREIVSIPKPSPDEIVSDDVRNFNWIVDDNIQSYSLHCKVKIDSHVVQEAKAELLNNYTPSKVIFTEEEDYFYLSKYEILHDRFGIGSKEIEQITNYLRDYADEHYFSNYQFANLILSFVHEQNIKYSYDEDSTGYFEYLRFPLETIYDVTGDCDCKAILACALFKRLGYRVAFVISPGHAAIAISIEPSLFFANYEMNGTNWFYCETTGDFWNPGELPDNINFKKVRLKEI